MSKVIADISMSLDGYVTARGVDQEHGLGVGGEAIHAGLDAGAAKRRCADDDDHRGILAATPG